MKFLLDTNAVSGLLNGKGVLLARAERLEINDLAVSSIVVHELVFGAFNGTRLEYNLNRLGTMPFPELPFEREDSMAAGEIRAYLRRQGTPIGAYDVLIAGQALARGLTLVTHNTREFSRVPGLKLEDWKA